MGRVAKYKKVKSFDPYSKKNRGNVDLGQVGVWGLGNDGRKKKKRSLKAEKLHARKHKLRSKSKFLDDGGFDIPPTEQDEFDMADLVGSIKKQTVGSSSSSSDAKKNEAYDKIITASGNVANIPKTEQDEIKVNRQLKLNQQQDQKSLAAKQLSHARQEGESKNAYSKRTKAETRQIIKQSATTHKNLEKLARKKEFLKNKKKRKKGGQDSSFYYNNDNNDENETDNNLPSKRQAADLPVRFGEQAERPPIFRQVPRGAKKTKSPATIVANSKSSDKKKVMSEDQIEAEKDAMELMRRRIQAQYRAIQSRRKDNNDFHL